MVMKQYVIENSDQLSDKVILLKSGSLTNDELATNLGYSVQSYSTSNNVKKISNLKH